MTDGHFMPSTGLLCAFTLDPAPCPRNHHLLIDIHLYYKSFPFSFFALSVSIFSRYIMCFRIGGGVAPGGVTYFNTFYVIHDHPR